MVGVAKALLSFSQMHPNGPAWAGLSFSVTILRQIVILVLVIVYYGSVIVELNK